MFFQLDNHCILLSEQSRNKVGIQLQSDIQNWICVKNIRNRIDTIKSNIEEDFCLTKSRSFTKNVFAKEICDVITSQMKDKFSYCGLLKAAQLCDSQSIPKYSK